MEGERQVRMEGNGSLWSAMEERRLTTLEEKRRVCMEGRMADCALQLSIHRFLPRFFFVKRVAIETQVPGKEICPQWERMFFLSVFRKGTQNMVYPFLVRL